MAPTLGTQIFSINNCIVLFYHVLHICWCVLNDNTFFSCLNVFSCFQLISCNESMDTVCTDVAHYVRCWAVEAHDKMRRAE